MFVATVGFDRKEWFDEEINISILDLNAVTTSPYVVERGRTWMDGWRKNSTIIYCFSKIFQNIAYGKRYRLLNFQTQP